MCIALRFRDPNNRTISLLNRLVGIDHNYVKDMVGRCQFNSLANEPFKLQCLSRPWRLRRIQSRSDSRFFEVPDSKEVTIFG